MRWTDEEGDERKITNPIKNMILSGLECCYASDMEVYIKLHCQIGSNYLNNLIPNPPV